MATYITYLHSHFFKMNIIFIYIFYPCAKLIQWIVQSLTWSKICFFFQLSVVQQVMCNIMLLLLFLRLQLLTSCKKCWYLAPQRQATLSNHVQGIPRNPFKFLLFRFFAWAWIILWQLPYKGLSTRKSSLHDWTCPAEWLLLTSCCFSLTPFCENLSPSWL